MKKILITGGTGYIGSHAAIEIMQKGEFEVISLDNYVNSSAKALERIKQITGKDMVNLEVDLTQADQINDVFEKYDDIVGIIHFAALKSVGDSVKVPLSYYKNNFSGLFNILDACERYGVNHFIFSSSCSVYGNVEVLPVNEQTPVSEPESPYAYTKLAGERIIRDSVKAVEKLNAISLRYFNPVGAHLSGLNGEDPGNKPNNLVPVITRTAAGWIPEMTVFGHDYHTRDGSCIRDYIHVVDLAKAHILAIEYLINGKNTSKYELYNLGSGTGVSVLEAIKTFEKVTGVSLNYKLGPRREGDVEAIYSDSSLAKEKLGWEPLYGIEEMMDSAWKWQQTLNAEHLQKI